MWREFQCLKHRGGICGLSALVADPLGEDVTSASLPRRNEFGADYFALYELPAAFRIDEALLDQRYIELQTRVHPDRFAGRGETEKRLSLQWATRANEAYQVLKKPLLRAIYLLQLAGYDLGSENNRLMPNDFLMEQMEWREAVAEARAAREHHQLALLHHRLQRDIRQRYDELASLFDDRRNLEQSADRVRRLMFLERLLIDIDDAMSACEES